MLTKSPWFASKFPRLGSRGLGWQPISDEGWAVTFAAIIALIAAFTRLDTGTIQGAGAVIGIMAVYAFVAFLTGASQP